MKSLLILLLVTQHSVISARSGLLSFVDGDVNAAGREHIGEGSDLTTRSNGRAEFMLSPYAYMRILGDTSVVLESESLESVAVRLVRGAAVIDAEEVDKDMPIRVRIGDLNVLVVKDGLYLFARDGLYVLDGEVRIEGTETKIKKDRLLLPATSIEGGGGESVGYESVGYEIVGFEAPPASPLLRWNARRASSIARSERRLSRPRLSSPFPFD